MDDLISKHSDDILWAVCNDVDWDKMFYNRFTPRAALQTVKYARVATSIMDDITLEELGEYLKRAGLEEDDSLDEEEFTRAVEEYVNANRDAVILMMAKWWVNMTVAPFIDSKTEEMLIAAIANY